MFEEYESIEEQIAYFFYRMNLYSIITIAFIVLYLTIWDFSLIYLMLDIVVFGVLYFACNTVHDCPFM